MRLFIGSFLIAMNLMLLVGVNLPDSVMRSPERDWCNAAETRKEGWVHSQNAPYKPLEVSRNRFDGSDELGKVTRTQRPLAGR